MASVVPVNSRHVQVKPSKRIREKMFHSLREVEFMCACDTSRENKAVTDELNSAQVTVVHIKGTAKNAADCKLRQSIRIV